MPRRELSKPAVCDICQASFASRSSMKRHKREKHGDRRFECPVCRMVCRKRLDALLDEHIRVKHPQNFHYYDANRNLIGSVTDRHPKDSDKENTRVLVPLQQPSNVTPLRMSPSLARRCEEILEGVDLFEGSEGYEPMNLDGTFPELDSVYHPTPVLAATNTRPTQVHQEQMETCPIPPISPLKETRKVNHPISVPAVTKAQPIKAIQEKIETCATSLSSPVKETRRVFVKKPRQIPLERQPGYKSVDPRNFQKQVMKIDFGESQIRCRNGIQFPVVEITETLEARKIKINCYKCYHEAEVPKAVKAPTNDACIGTSDFISEDELAAGVLTGVLKQKRTLSETSSCSSSSSSCSSSSSSTNNDSFISLD